jgi:cell wall-associated NlpC family hydrolase
MRVAAHRLTRLPAFLLTAILATALLALPTPSTAQATTLTLGQRALAVAKLQYGDRYVYGAAGPNAFDCSGLTQYSYARVGRVLPHNALRQYQVTHHILLSQLRAGDLVFMNFSGGGPSGISHVGIYAGSGYWVVASTYGTPVRLQHIWTWRGVYASRP